MTKSAKSPFSIAVVIAALLALAGLYAWFLSAERHAAFAAAMWALAVLWLGLGWVTRKGTRP